MTSKPAQSSAVMTIGSISAIIVLFALLFLGHKYKDDCLAAGKDFEQCWEKGLTIAGMNAGGPVSAVAIVSYLIGQANKEKEKAEKYQQGFWTLDPALDRNKKPQEASPGAVDQASEVCSLTRFARPIRTRIHRFHCLRADAGSIALRQEQKYGRL